MERARLPIKQNLLWPVSESPQVYVFFVIAVSSTFPLVRMSTNSSGVCSTQYKKFAAVQLLHRQSRICTISGLEMLRKARPLIWKVKAGRGLSFICLAAFLSFLSILMIG